jgi:phosphate-selective porin OprO and OprP
VRNSRIIIAAVATALVWGSAAPSRGQETAPPKAVEEQIREIEQRQQAFEKKVQADQEALAAKASEAPVLGAGSEGFFLRSADSRFVLRLRGYIQVDGRFWIDDEDPAMTNTFLIRRARPIMEGVLWKYFGFKIMPDFAEGKTVLFDAYIDFTYLQQAKLRVGKFKVPVGLERLQSGTDLLFVERALPTNLVPNRDVGVQVYADLFDQALTYAAGIFNGVPDLGNADLDIDDDKEFAGRVFAHPFKPTSIQPLQGLGLGVAGTVGSRAGNATATGLPYYKTPAQQIFFNYLTDTKAPQNTVVSTGMQYRVSPQAYYYWKPLGILWEYVLSSQNVKKKAQIERFQNTSWQIAASVVVTGEDASYKGVSPRNPLDPAAGGWGAFEVAGRYAELKVDPDIFPEFSDPKKSARQAREWAIGLNWYLNRNVRVMLDYEQTSFQAGGTTTGGALADREDEHAILSRFQISF